jgi:hypothetical protein
VLEPLAFTQRFLLPFLAKSDRIEVEDRIVPREMIALSVKQPWANLIAQGRKTLEIRSWSTPARKGVLLCSSASPAIYPAGFAIAVIDIVECRPFARADEDAACVEHIPGMYAWVIANVRRINPIPVKGRLGFFRVEVGPKGQEPRIVTLRK